MVFGSHSFRSLVAIGMDSSMYVAIVIATKATALEPFKPVVFRARFRENKQSMANKWYVGERAVSVCIRSSKGIHSHTLHFHQYKHSVHIPLCIHCTVLVYFSFHFQFFLSIVNVHGTFFLCIFVRLRNNHSSVPSFPSQRFIRISFLQDSAGFHFISAFLYIFLNPFEKHSNELNRKNASSIIQNFFSCLHFNRFCKYLFDFMSFIQQGFFFLINLRSQLFDW